MRRSKLAGLAFAIGSISILLVAGTSGAASNGGTFTDDNGNVHEGMIEAIAAAGITQGCASGEYCPSDSVTRAQMATFIVRALQLPASSVDQFTDDNGNVHEANINALAAAGVTTGCETGRYCPNDSVTRAQMASFLDRALNLLDPTTDYFVDDAGSPHEAAVNAMAESGITLGCGGNNYCPNDAVPRDQMASFLGRGLGLVPGTRTLVASYYQMYENVNSEGKKTEFPDTERMQYIPRGAASGLDLDLYEDVDPWNYDILEDVGAYQGWDILITDPNWPHYKTDRDDFLYLDLNRPATVALAWIDGGPLPAWLQSWQLGGTVTVDGELITVYEKVFGAGEQWLASPGGTDEESVDMYVLFFAEADGTPSAPAATPNGQATPSPNVTCPGWVHDQYTTLAPDGSEQASWHPQIDPVYWCNFNHDHGSDPMLIPGAPRIGYMYVSDNLIEYEGAAPESPHEGFKEFIMPYEDYWVRFVVHASTSEPRRVCGQFHTMYNEVYDSYGNQLYSSSLKVDFGRATSTDTGEDIDDPCVAGPNEFARRIRTDPSFDNFNYENWDASPGTNATELLGMEFRFRFDVRDPMSACTDLTCDTLVQLTNPEPTSANGYGGVPEGVYGRNTATKRTHSMTAYAFNDSATLANAAFIANPFTVVIITPPTT